MNMWRLRWVSCGAAAVFLFISLGGGAPSVQASEAVDRYPEQPIRLIVPFSAGGPNDILARLIGDALSEKWDVGVVVDNRPGGGTVIGTQIAAGADPDGYTLLIVSTSTASNVSLKQSLPYDAFEDFTPVIQFGEAPSVLVVHPDVAVESVEDLLELGRSKPGEVLWGSGGIGTSTDLKGHLLTIMGEVEMNNIPYEGAGPANVDLLGGRLDWMFGNLLSTLPLVEAGELRAIAVSSRDRNSALPDVPSVGETLPGFEAVAWWGMFAPAGTPPEIVLKLNEAINEILETEQVRDFLASQGTTPVGGTPEDFASFFRTDVDRWAYVIETAGIEPQ